MEAYQHILVAVDFTPSTNQVLARAHHLAKQESATLYLVHVVEPSPVDFLDQTMLVDINLDEMLLKNARQQVQALADKYAIPASNVFTEIGSVKNEVFSIVEKKNIDCLVVGSHGRHGFGLLLGSTANSLLHGASCDVLAVRVKE